MWKAAAVPSSTRSSIKKSSPFYRLVDALKQKAKSVTVVESSCGGTISSSIMAVPGSSNVYYGGSVAYNTKLGKPFLLNDDDLHQRLMLASSTSVPPAAAATTVESSRNPRKDNKASSADIDLYIRSKLRWTTEAAKAFCKEAGVDYAIAEGGATGPTFRPAGMTKGFTAIAIAGKDELTGEAKILSTTVVHSTHANRAANMRHFADAAADFAVETIMGKVHENDDEEDRNNESMEVDGPWLNRRTLWRTDPAMLQSVETRSTASCVVLLDSTECLMSTSPDDGSNPNLARIPINVVLSWEDENAFPRTFLGTCPMGNPIFSIDVTRDDLPTISTLQEGGFTFQNTRTHAPLLPPQDNELALTATALSNWKRTHKHCSMCGCPLRPVDGGTSLICSACGAQSWPRQDPSIIVLVTNRTGDKALLARSPRHPPKMHTALAGFVEAGETFEQAVLREAYEEIGIHVDRESITYLSSQPWPFPRSCMIAFRATADEDQTIELDPDEIVSASWFDKRQVGEAARIPGAVMDRDVANRASAENPSLDVMIPPKGVVARTLIDDWLEEA
jgi:NAD+ diphosphatase